MAVLNKCERCGVEDDPTVGNQDVLESTHVVGAYWQRSYQLCDKCGLVMIAAIESAMSQSKE